MKESLINLKLIAKGGQKTVYYGVHHTHGQVVYKTIDIEPDSHTGERARREVLAVKALQSFVVPRIYDHNCEDSTANQIWILEEYIDGKNLRQAFNDKDKFNIKDVCQFIGTALDLAVEIEKLNIVHRDIKPENIIIDKGGKFWIIDFGIARHLDLDSLTDTAAPFAPFSLGYAASEQFKNLKKDIDIRTDLFAIGVVAYEMLNGTNPYIEGAHNALDVLQRISKINIPLCKIFGDTQFQLSAFISLLADPKRIKRPRTAIEAREIFNVVKSTCNLN